MPPTLIPSSSLSPFHIAHASYPSLSIPYNHTKVKNFFSLCRNHISPYISRTLIENEEKRNEMKNNFNLIHNSLILYHNLLSYLPFSLTLYTPPSSPFKPNTTITLLQHHPTKASKRVPLTRCTKRLNSLHKLHLASCIKLHTSIPFIFSSSIQPP